MPLVRATEHGTEQTESCHESGKRCGVAGLSLGPNSGTLRALESAAIKCDSHVRATEWAWKYPEYRSPNTEREPGGINLQL